MYLKIENPGVVGSDLLSIVGASTARGSNNLIGQFGSGFKYSVSLLLRNSLDFRLFVGKDGFTFEVDERTSKDVVGRAITINEVVMKQVAGSSRKRRNMGFDMGFGALDWDNVGMACREFISNAADASMLVNSNYEGVVVELVEDNQVRAKDGFTRIFIQANDEIRRYFNNLNNNFLIFSNPNPPTIIRKGGVSPLKIYRKGVLVGEFEQQSIFNYNIDELTLRESRTIEYSEACEAAARTLKYTDEMYLQLYLEAVRDKTTCFETSLHPGYFRFWSYDKPNPAWTTAFRRVFGDSIVCDNDYVADVVKRKGLRAARIDARYTSSFQSAGIKVAEDVLDTYEIAGREKFSLTSDQLSYCNRVWEVLVGLGVTNGKPFPNVEGFHDLMNAESSLHGYWDDARKVIGINKNVVDSGGYFFITTFVEEVAHYVTGSGDNTRDFQEYAFNIVGKLLARELN